MKASLRSAAPGLMPRRSALCVALACAVMCGEAAAFNIDTGVDGLKMRFDNTIRYTLGQRVQKQSDAIIGNPNFDDGDRNFDRGAIVNNRIDILSEFDMVYNRDFGVRVSAAGWLDAAYSGSLDNTNLATSNHFESGQPAFGLSDYANRYFNGPSGEWLDAYVFGKVDLGDMPLRVRAGRHTINWGESLLGSGAIHGVSYGQAPLDMGKALALPGVEAKELYLPRTQISAQLQVTPEFSLAAQYFLEWRYTRFPEAGTYLGFGDPYLRGGESMILGPDFYVMRGGDITPKKTGDWGVMAQWRPDWLDGTLGFYGRRLSDTMPAEALVVLDANPKYYLDFASDIDMYGVSLSKQYAGISFGVDVNYRHNMPLLTETILLEDASGLPTKGNTLGARGNTVHAVVNALGQIGGTPLWDVADWIVEGAWMRWLSVSQGEQYFMGRDDYTAIDRVSKDAFTLSVNFEPAWYRVFSGANLSMPLSYSVGLGGNAAVNSGGNKGAMSYSAGLALDYLNRYRIDLKYVGYTGKYDIDPLTGAMETPNGTEPMLKDRGAWFLTFKTTL